MSKRVAWANCWPIVRSVRSHSWAVCPKSRFERSAARAASSLPSSSRAHLHQRACENGRSRPSSAARTGALFPALHASGLARGPLCRAGYVRACGWSCGASTTNHGPYRPRSLRAPSKRDPSKSGVQQAGAHDEFTHAVDAGARLQVGEYERLRAAHLFGVAIHDLERGTNVRGQIDLVDNQEIALGDPGATFARDFVASSDVDHIHRQIRQLWAEGRCQVDAAAIDDHQIESGELAIERGHGLEIDRCIFTDGRVRTAPGLDADDPIVRKRPAPQKKIRVFAGVDVIGHDGNLVALTQTLAQRIDQSRLPRADGPTYTKPQRRFVFHEQYL